jgi:MinD-like ATPase involved in chromosome partitioning or flagellar assembly
MNGRGDMSRRLLVSVDSPSGRHTLAVPEDARIEDLMPSLVEVCEGSSDSRGWSLAPMGEAPLAGEETLGRRGLFPGAVLVLAAPLQPADAEPEAYVPSASDLAQRLKARLQPSTDTPDIDRMSDADYLRFLENAIVAPRSGASTVVAVISAHAGRGTTTVTVLLATLLSTLRNDQVVAVDACPQSGALSHWIAPESGLAADSYRSLFEATLTPEQVQAALVRVGRGLALLPAPTDQRLEPAADEQAWVRLIQHLRHLSNFVILDCGAGFRRASTRAALSAADQVVLVSKSAPGEAAPGRIIESLRGQGRTVAIVANQASKRARATTSNVGVQQLSLAFEPQPARRLRTRGFSWTDAPSSWQESIRELAAVLVGSST